MSSYAQVGLAYANAHGEILFDATAQPFADDGVYREPDLAELIPAPEGTIPTLLPQRRPRLIRGKNAGRTALAALLPAGYTRLLLPAYESAPGAPTLPLYGYTYACVVDDELYVAAAHTDQRPDWAPRRFAKGRLEAAIERRMASDPQNPVLKQTRICALEYGCFTAQNVFLEQGEAAIPVSPKCNAKCVGCISEQEPESKIRSPQIRIQDEMDIDAVVRLGVHHLEHVDDGIVSFGQGCEGEPLLRSTTIAKAIAAIRAKRSNGIMNCNTNGSLPRSLRSLIDAGLQAVRISLNSFRPAVYAAYYRPAGYTLDDVFESIRMAVNAGLRVSLNVLTHPGVSDDEAELKAMRAFFYETTVALVQTRTLNIDPAVYFTLLGRPAEPLGMLTFLEELGSMNIPVGNFTSKDALQ